MSSKGKLIVYTGASGVGKGTVMKKILEKDPTVRLSVSVTTRSPRPEDIEGVTYSFVTTDEFENMISDNAFLEYAKYCTNYYGTPEKPVEEMLSKGINVMLEIEVQGGLQIMEKRPDCTSIFIMPPSEEELERRLRGRGTETEDVILERLAAAKTEMTFADKYDHIVVNDDVAKTADEIINIIHS